MESLDKNGSFLQRRKMIGIRERLVAEKPGVRPRDGFLFRGINGPRAREACEIPAHVIGQRRASRARDKVERALGALANLKLEEFDGRP